MSSTSTPRERNSKANSTAAKPPTGQFSSPDGIAIDNNDPSSPSVGDVYVVDPGHNVIDKFSATGAYLSQLAETPAGKFVGVAAVAGEERRNGA